MLITLCKKIESIHIKERLVSYNDFTIPTQTQKTSHKGCITLPIDTTLSASDKVIIIYKLCSSQNSEWPFSIEYQLQAVHIDEKSWLQAVELLEETLPVKELNIPNLLNNLRQRLHLKEEASLLSDSKASNSSEAVTNLHNQTDCDSRDALISVFSCYLSHKIKETCYELHKPQLFNDNLAPNFQIHIEAILTTQPSLIKIRDILNVLTRGRKSSPIYLPTNYKNHVSEFAQVALNDLVSTTSFIKKNLSETSSMQAPSSSSGAHVSMPLIAPNTDHLSDTSNVTSTPNSAINRHASTSTSTRTPNPDINRHASTSAPLPPQSNMLIETCKKSITIEMPSVVSYKELALYFKTFAACQSSIVHVPYIQVMHSGTKWETVRNSEQYLYISLAHINKSLWKEIENHIHSSDLYPSSPSLFQAVFNILQILNSKTSSQPSRNKASTAEDIANYINKKSTMATEINEIWKIAIGIWLMAYTVKTHTIIRANSIKKEYEGYALFLISMYNFAKKHTSDTPQSRSKIFTKQPQHTDVHYELNKLNNTYIIDIISHLVQAIAKNTTVTAAEIEQHHQLPILHRSWILNKQINSCRICDQTPYILEKHSLFDEEILKELVDNADSSCEVVKENKAIKHVAYVMLDWDEEANRIIGSETLSISLVHVHESDFVKIKNIYHFFERSRPINSVASQFKFFFSAEKEANTFNAAQIKKSLEQLKLCVGIEMAGYFFKKITRRKEECERNNYLGLSRLITLSPDFLKFNRSQLPMHLTMLKKQNPYENPNKRAIEQEAAQLTSLHKRMCTNPITMNQH